MKLLLYLLFALSILNSCSQDANKTKEEKITKKIELKPDVKTGYYSTDPCMGKSYKEDAFSISKLQRSQMPYITGRKHLPRSKKYDDNNVPLFILDNRPNYHPVYMIQHALDLLDVFETTGDSVLVKKAIKITDKLTQVGMELDSALLFVYTSDFKLHSYGDQNMQSPWFSAMAQGQGLSLLLRVQKLTNDSSYFYKASKVFNSFKRMKGMNANPWFSCVDTNGNLWLEEFPRPVPCLTLNGMIFAIFGVYEYYITTNDELAKSILLGALTTIKTNIEKYRVEGDLSYYCLKHKVQNLGYHNVHIYQLQTLFDITEDSAFIDMHNHFNEDVDHYLKKQKELEENSEKE